MVMPVNYAHENPDLGYHQKKWLSDFCLTHRPDIWGLQNLGGGVILSSNGTRITSGLAYKVIVAEGKWGKITCDSDGPQTVRSLKKAVRI